MKGEFPFVYVSELLTILTVSIGTLQEFTHQAKESVSRRVKFVVII